MLPTCPSFPTTAPHMLQVVSFYTAACLCIASSMYNLVTTSFIVVSSQGLSLRGPPGSIARCVEICAENW